MNKNITKSSYWKPGQSGNPKGRPRRNQILTELLRQQGETYMMVGSEEVTAQEALARAVWQFVSTGEVWLAGKKLKAESASEWANVVKWLYGYVEPTRPATDDEAEGNELIVRVIREGEGE
jgi:Family of unknown function (DUF5681)